MDPTIFGSDVVDNVDDVLAAHVNNLRAWHSNFTPLIVNMGSVSDTDGVTTFTDTDLPFQSVDCLGDTDYKVYLPTESTDNHPFFIFNASTDTNVLNVLSATSDTIDAISQNSFATYISNGTAWARPSSTDTTHTHTLDCGINIIIGDGTNAVTTDIKGYIEIPFNMTITAARLVADASGSIVIDVWMEDYANFPPTDADSITASAPPTLSSAVKSEDTTLTGWTKALVKNEWLAFYVDSAATVKQVTLSLTGTRAST